MNDFKRRAAHRNSKLSKMTVDLRTYLPVRPGGQVGPGGLCDDTADDNDDDSRVPRPHWQRGNLAVPQRDSLVACDYGSECLDSPDMKARGRTSG